MAGALVIYEGRAAEAEDDLLVSDVGHPPEDVYVEDAGDVAMSADVLVLAGAIHADLGALQLPPSNIALGGTVEADVDAPAAQDADAVLLASPSFPAPEKQRGARAPEGSACRGPHTASA